MPRSTGKQLHPASSQASGAGRNTSCLTIAKRVPEKKEPMISPSQLLMWLEATTSGPSRGTFALPSKRNRRTKSTRAKVRQNPAVSR